MAAHLFGEHLRREREMRGVSLEEVSAATRISVRFLEALESEQWERLPGGIFNRGFIRSVAHFLGLDEEGLIAEYALETHERPEIAVWTKEPVAPRPNWTAIIGTIVIVLALIAGGWFVYERYGAQVSAWHQQHPIVKSVMARIHRQQPATQNGTSAVSAPDGTRQTTLPTSPSTASQAAADGTQTGNAQSANAPRPNGAVTQTSIPGTNSQTSTVPLQLKVEAGETSEVTVIADGKAVFSGRLEALRTLQFKAQKSFTVTSSKSSAVLLELNGNTVPPLGPPGEPGKITLTRDNLKPGTGDGN